jgi:hypothetical protein
MKRMTVMVAVAAFALTWTSAGAAPKEVQEDGGAWLGIIFTTVPKALAAHLDVGDEGVMVQNVVKGSPADKAGLEQYDVIVAAEGKKMGPADLHGAIAGRSPGDRVKLDIRHKAAERKVTVELGGRPTDAIEYKYEVIPEGPEGVDFSRVLVHPGMTFRKGESGWKVHEHGKLPEEIQKMLKDLPKDFPGIRIQAAPGQGGIAMKYALSMKDDDGQTVRIEREGDGEIVVERSGVDENGKEFSTRKTYKNDEELRKKDPAAHKLFQGAQVNVNVVGPGMMKGFIGGKGGMPENIAKQIEKQLQEAMPKGMMTGRAEVRVIERHEDGTIGGMTEEELDKKIQQAVREALKAAREAEGGTRKKK